ncbi:unnamed protein product [Linum tenue]|uniref:Uncharacterized protein n=1 Tax=Linum tenue TaxID=586396 RepID=A0AAV0MM04_9ROSI|nr:unnamed protein product [Linum tenue]
MNCNGKKLGFAAIAAPSNPNHSSVGPIASLPSSAPPAPTESSAICTPSCPEDSLDWTPSRVRRMATTSGCRSKWSPLTTGGGEETLASVEAYFVERS